MNKDVVKEIWKTYPEFDWIQGSNFGRVRTIDRVVTYKNDRKHLVKGRILNQHRDKGGYLKVGFSVNGKHVNRYAHRIIAMTFIQNPDNLSQVNHKDNNQSNNNVSNLEWCTPEYNIAYREKYGVSAKSYAKVLNRPVYAVNLETLEVLKFESRSEASRELGICNQNICAVIKGKLNQAGGYWFFEDTSDDFEIDKSRLRRIQSGMYFKGGVFAINLETHEILRFESQSEASRTLGIMDSDINNVIKGRRKTACGYWFVNDDGNAVEVVKNKLHDIGGTGLKL